LDDASKNQMGGDRKVQEVPFQEYRIKIGDLLITRQQSSLDKHDHAGAQACQGHQYIAKVLNVPTGMISSADYNKIQNHTQVELCYPMNNHCTSRSFDELLGYVDLQLLAQADASGTFHALSGQSSHFNQAHPICLFTPAPPSLLENFSAAQKESQTAGLSTLQSQVEALESMKGEMEELVKQLQETAENAAEKPNVNVKEVCQTLQDKLDELEEAMDAVDSLDEELSSRCEEAQESMSLILRKLSRYARY